MKDKIIKLHSREDEKNFEKKLWLYRSMFFRNTRFVIDGKTENENYENIIKALNIKNRLKRITYIYDTVCKQIDNYNIANNISCEYKNGKCGAHKNTKHYNGCCRVCMHQSETGCTTTNTACKLYFCGYVCSKKKPLTYKDIKLFKCLSIRCQFIANTNLFLSRRSSLISLYTGSILILTFFHSIDILTMPFVFIKNRKIAISKYGTQKSAKV